jgi:hypothetical protein
MKTLRLLRNIAALFIFGAALLVPRSGRADFGFHPPSNCTSSPCEPGKPCMYLYCANQVYGSVCLSTTAAYNCYGTR